MFTTFLLSPSLTGAVSLLLFLFLSSSLSLSLSLFLFRGLSFSFQHCSLLSLFLTAPTSALVAQNNEKTFLYSLFSVLYFSLFPTRSQFFSFSSHSLRLFFHLSILYVYPLHSYTHTHINTLDDSSLITKSLFVFNSTTLNGFHN